MDTTGYQCVSIDQVLGPAELSEEIALWTSPDLIDSLLERLDQYGWKWSGGITIPEFHPVNNGHFTTEIRDGGGLWMMLPPSGQIYYLIPGSKQGLPACNNRYVLTGPVAVTAGLEPRNNDGRMECFWCRVPTQKRGGGMYDVCPKCSR